MKIRFIAFLLLCVFLAGCANAESHTEQPTESVPVETKAEETVHGTMIYPLTDMTMASLENSFVNISFSQDDFCQDESGNMLLRMQVYSYDKYDMVDISGLKPGDIILLSGEQIPVTSVESNDYGTVLVNGGLDEGGLDLATDDCGVYYIQGYSDMKSWYLVGEVTLPLSDGFVFTDTADLDFGVVTYERETLLNEFPAPEYGYQPQNTSVRIENGMVVAMDRIYTP